MASRFRDRLGGRLRQIGLTFQQTRAADPRLVSYMLIAALVGLAVPLLVLTYLGAPIVGVISGLATAAAAAMLILGIRGQRAAIARIEGQPGAALAVVQSLRGAWKVTPAVAFSGKQDLVHRVVGRPGVVLIGEGRRARVKALLRQEARKTARISGDVPVHEINVGTADGQVELAQLRVHLMKLPRAVKTKEIGALERRLAALGGSDLPIPKGPLPNIRRPR
ncbi:MAG: DUF4191 domain-containing protein [Actinobacteria bacterium]|nr:DUF4191 domain-containing protein [Actinomycetota bacterium]